jgi:large subunit ribosomal protein L25
MSEVTLNAVKREIIGKKVSGLRRQGKLPAVLYGHTIKATPITLDAKEAATVLSSLSSSSLVTIDLEGNKHSALVRDKDRNFIKGHLLHVDFQVVSLTEKIKADVSIEQIGLSPAVKDYSGVVVTELFAVEVESLPGDLPEKIVIDLSTLKHIGDSIFVRDLDVPANVVILQDPDEVVVLIASGQIEPELAGEPGTEVDLGKEPEVIVKVRKEDFED